MANFIRVLLFLLVVGAPAHDCVAATEEKIDTVVVTKARSPDNLQVFPVQITIMPVIVYRNDMAIQVAEKACSHAPLPDNGHWSATLNDEIWDVRYLTKDSKPDCIPARVRIFETTGGSDGCIACIPAR